MLAEIAQARGSPTAPVRVSNAFSFTFLCAIAFLFVSGCESIKGTMSRTENESSTTIWQSFDHVKHDFSAIEPGKTKVEDLVKFGMGPGSQNVTKIPYLKLRSHFIGDQKSLANEDLPVEIQKCIAKKDSCYGLIVKAQNLHKLGLEDLTDRMTQAKKKTQITGWRFEGIIALVDDLVVYAKPGTEDPNVYSMTDGKDPQSVLEKIIAPVTGFFSFF